jgi:hypothetical protein
MASAHAVRAHLFLHRVLYIYLQVLRWSHDVYWKVEHSRYFPRFFFVSAVLMPHQSQACQLQAIWTTTRRAVDDAVEQLCEAASATGGDSKSSAHIDTASRVNSDAALLAISLAQATAPNM